MGSRRYLLLLLLTIFTLALIMASLSWGSVASPQDVLAVLLGQENDAIISRIVWELRMPRVVAAILAGAALGISGLVLQTIFCNPLAGPHVLGISSGASLGVAILLLAGWGNGQWGLILSASVGSGLVLSLVLILARWVQSPVSLMVLGLMIGYLVESLVGVLLHFAGPERVQAYLGWSFGSFSRLVISDIPAFALVVGFAILLVLVSLRFLNASLLGEQAASTLGIAIKPYRLAVLSAAALLAAVTTVYCGPIAFLGLAVPHLGRALFRTANHRWLIPACIIIGANIAMLAGWVAQLPGRSGVLPLNAVLALIGAPVVLAILLPRRGREDS